MIKRDGKVTPSHVIAQSCPKELLRISDDLWFCNFNQNQMITVNDEFFINYLTRKKAKFRVLPYDIKRRGTHKFSNLRTKIGFLQDDFENYAFIERLLKKAQSLDLWMDDFDFSQEERGVVISSDLGDVRVSQNYFCYLQKLGFDSFYYENKSYVYFRKDEDVVCLIKPMFDFS